MDKITIHASGLRNFGDSGGASFYLITSPSLTDEFSIENGYKYQKSYIVSYAGGIGLAQFIQEKIPVHTHILVILPDTYVKSPAPEALGKQRKLAVMACSSTPSSIEAIRHFLSVAEKTDPDAQEQTARHFFYRGSQAKQLYFIDNDYQTCATFNHLSDALSWHEQLGKLDWGEQQLLPSGEISVLPVNVFGQDINSAFSLDGELALRGYPVLHSGTPSYCPSDQQRIFHALTSMKEHALIATVNAGVISRLTATSPHCQPAANILQSMFDVDSRYRNLLEIGFGINTELTLFEGNSAMNEVYGNRQGVVHFGLGLIPYTQYHLDLLCPGTSVLDEQKNPVLSTTPATTYAQPGQMQTP